MAMRALGAATIAAVSLFAVTPPADAARITPVEGEILVNSGAGYQRIDGAAQLKPGDSAIANPNARASLVYDDGCIVDVVPGMVAWVEPASPCGAGARAARDPAPLLSSPRTFDPAWLLDDAYRIKRRQFPAGP